MGNSSEKIGVIIPTCGIRDTLWKTLDSVYDASRRSRLGQISVRVNAGYESSAIAQEIASKVGDWLNVIPSAENQQVPMPRNWNDCVRIATTQYVHILHDDDLVSPYFYDAVSGLIDNYPDGSLYSTACILFGNSTSYYYGPKVEGFWEDAAQKLSKRNYFFCPGVVFSKRHFRGFDETFNLATDWKTWYDLASSGPTYHTSQPLAYYRVHDGSITSSVAKSDAFTMEIRRILEGAHTGDQPVDYTFADESALTSALNAAYRGDLANTFHHLILGNQKKFHLKQTCYVLQKAARLSLSKAFARPPDQSS